MSDKYVLAVDAGSTGARCLITDLKGNLVSLGQEKWAYVTPRDVSPLAREFNPQLFWRIICRAIRKAIGKAHINPADIIGVSATSQREGTVFLDKEGRELYAGPNIDLRALSEGMLIDNEFGEEIYSLTGHKPSFLFVPAKLKWFEANRPEIYHRIAKVLTVSDWIIYKLSGEPVGEVCGANELGLVDLRERKWSNKLQGLLKLPEGIYPRLGEAGDLVGMVSHRAALESGLPQGIAVSLSTPDTQCGLIGLGIKEEGEAGIIAGWSAPIQMVTDKPILDSQARLWTGCYVLRKWVLESNAGEAGSIYYWIKEVMFGRSKLERVYGLMDRLAQQAPAGAEGTLAFLGPEAMNMTRLGLKYGGFLFPLPLNTADIRREHLIRGMLENLCFAIKANCIQLEESSGLKIKKISLGGSLAKSECLAQILPAVLNFPVSLPDFTEVSALGAAICAATGAGIYSCLEEAINAMKAKDKIIEPEPLTASEYAEYYQKWEATGKWLEKLSEEIL